MKIRHKTAALVDKIELNMTPMIDCVFQLLAFFIMTLKFVVPEGDFDIKMPSVSPDQQVTQEDLMPPIIVKLLANNDGSLKGIAVGGKNLGGFEALRKKVIEIVGTSDQGPGAAGSGAEVEIDCDFDLKYEHLISAVTHVSGYIDANGNTVKLVEKLKFKPPKAVGR